MYDLNSMLENSRQASRVMFVAANSHISIAYCIVTVMGNLTAYNGIPTGPFNIYYLLFITRT